MPDFCVGSGDLNSSLGVSLYPSFIPVAVIATLTKMTKGRTGLSQLKVLGIVYPSRQWKHHIHSQEITAYLLQLAHFTFTVQDPSQDMVPDTQARLSQINWCYQKVPHREVHRPTVLVSFYCCDKYHHQEHLRKGKALLKLPGNGSPGQELEPEAIEEHCLLAHPQAMLSFLLCPRTTCPENGAIHSHKGLCIN